MPLSLAFALTIGWFNGTIVDKTKLPSFIVTLGTFFMLIGAKLSFAKLFAGQVVVEGLDESAGYDFWSKVFAASWIRNDHLWEDRDIVWTILVIAGVGARRGRRARAQLPRAPTPRNSKGLIALARRRWSSPSPASTACSTATASARTSSTALVVGVGDPRRRRSGGALWRFPRSAARLGRRRPRRPVDWC